MLAVPSRTGVALLDPSDGAVQRRYAVTPPPAGSLVYPLGTGFLVAGPRTARYR